jgi:PadR family transcriptional regulator PadR
LEQAMPSPLAKVESDLIRGAGPTAVLQLLARREMYGYELVSMLRDETAGTLALGHSTLYPLLYNLEAKGLITSEERVVESGRARRYYSVTAAGRKALKQQREQWQSLTGAMVKLGIVSPATAG